jgi:hypothetical protein
MHIFGWVVLTKVGLQMHYCIKFTIILLIIKKKDTIFGNEGVMGES